MPVCPGCKNEIKTMINVRSGLMTSRVDLNENGETIRQEQGFAMDDEYDIFVCPYCDVLISSNEKDAIKFLSGGK